MTVRSSNGNTKQSKMMSIRLPTDRFAICPMVSFSKGWLICSSLIEGSRLWLHFPYTTPSFMSSRPGLLLTMVFNVISSV